MTSNAREAYLHPTYYLDSDSSIVRETAETVAQGKKTDTDKAVALFYWVRDTIPYYAYDVAEDPADYKASAIITGKSAWCVPKALALAAMARALGIPSRLHFADIKNHQIGENLLQLMKTNLFYYHGYTEVFIHGDWMKATPAFNKELCENRGQYTVEFDGYSHGMLPAANRAGDQHIEYIEDRGVFEDLPFELLFKFFREKYPPLSGFRESNIGP